MIEDLGISRTQMSTAYLIGTLIGALALPWIGQAIDRFGVRRTMAIIGAIFGSMLIAMSLVANIVGLTAGFVGIRMMGQGSNEPDGNNRGCSVVHPQAWFRHGHRGCCRRGWNDPDPTLHQKFDRRPWVGGTLWVIEGLAVVGHRCCLSPSSVVRNRASEIGQHVDGGSGTGCPGDEIWVFTRKKGSQLVFLGGYGGWCHTRQYKAVFFIQIELAGSEGLTHGAEHISFRTVHLWGPWMGTSTRSAECLMSRALGVASWTSDRFCILIHGQG
jgi:hypothetical protein